MKNLFLSAFIGVLTLVSCASAANTSLSGKETEKEVNVSRDYKTLTVSHNVKAVYSQDATVLTIKADTAIIPFVKVVERGGRLNIYLDCNSNQVFREGVGRVIAIVPASSSLQKVELSGVAELECGEISAENMNVTLSGASRVNADFSVTSTLQMNLSGAARIVSSLSAETLDIVASGAAKADFSGKVNLFNLKASGAAEISSGKSNVETEKFVCSLSGASGVKVRANVSADGNISGASKLKVYGGANVGISTSGASSLSVIR